MARIEIISLELPSGIVIGGENSTIKTLGEKLKNFRARHQVSMETVMHAADLSVSTILNLEHGRTGKPRGSTVRKLLSYMDFMDNES